MGICGGRISAVFAVVELETKPDLICYQKCSDACCETCLGQGDPCNGVVTLWLRC